MATKFHFEIQIPIFTCENSVFLEHLQSYIFLLIFAYSLNPCEEVEIVSFPSSHRNFEGYDSAFYFLFFTALTQSFQKLCS